MDFFVSFVFEPMTTEIFYYLFSSAPPRFTKTPNRVITVNRGTNVSASCQAFGFPWPKIVWSRGLVPLPQGRTSVRNGTLDISHFDPKDSGTYQCTASNKLGSVSALTTLYYIHVGMSGDNIFLFPKKAKDFNCC